MSKGFLFCLKKYHFLFSILNLEFFLLGMNQASGNLNQETKNRLCEKVSLSLQELSVLSKHLLKTSKSSDFVMQANKTTASHEVNLESSTTSLNRINLIVSQLHFQAESIGRNLALIDEVKDQIDGIIR